MGLKSKNFYIILGLDPTVDDWKMIESTINSAVSKWNSAKVSGPTSKKNEAVTCLAMVDDMRKQLQEQATRRKIANEAKREIAEAKRQAYKTLKDHIEFFRNSGDVLSVKAADIIVKELDGFLTRDQVFDEFESLGVAVDRTGKGAKNKPKATKKSRPKLDAVTAKEVKEYLELVALGSLYELLGKKFGYSSSPKTLYKAAETLYNDLQSNKEIDSNGKPTQLWEAKEKLVGYAKSIFKNDAEKEKYDNTLAVQEMENLHGLLNVAGCNGVITPDIFDKLLESACDRGVEKDRAREYIEEYADKRKWSILENSTSSNRLVQCGNCYKLTQSNGVKCCPNCGKSLERSCPRCGERGPTSNKSCVKCGYNIGDIPYVEELVKEGNAALAKSNSVRANKYFREALDIISDWKDALAGIKAADEIEAEKKKHLKKINDAISKRTLQEAKRLLDAFEKRFDSKQLHITKKIERGIDDAERVFKDAARAKSRGDSSKAIQGYEEALLYCADYEPALSALRSIPAPIVTNLSIDIKGSAAVLTWNPVKDPNYAKYQINRSSVHPANSRVGIKLSETVHPQYYDSDYPAGEVFYYAVYTMRGDITSEIGAILGPFLRTAEIDKLEVVTGICEVTLTWKLPKGSCGVEIWRQVGSAPTKIGMGTKLFASRTTITDKGLAAGKSYGYLIVACYDNPESPGTIIYSKGVSTYATPQEELHIVEDLKSTLNNNEVTLTWSAIRGQGTVEIYESSTQPSYHTGTAISLSKLTRLGTLIQKQGTNKARSTITTSDKVYFTPVTISGSVAVIGKTTIVRVSQGVKNLKARRAGERIFVTFDWPQGVSEVYLAYSYKDRWPHPNTCKSLPISKEMYKLRNKYVLERLPNANIYIGVYNKDEDNFTDGAFFVIR